MKNQLRKIAQTCLHTAMSAAFSISEVKGKPFYFRIYSIISKTTKLFNSEPGPQQQLGWPDQTSLLTDFKTFSAYKTFRLHNSTRLTQ